MNLHRILEIQKGLPPSDLHSLLFARKSAVNSVEFQTVTATGYPCILENSAGKSAVNYRIYGNSAGIGNPVHAGLRDVDGLMFLDYKKSAFRTNDIVGYCIPIAVGGKNLFDKNQKTVNGFISNNGDILANIAWGTSADFIKIAPLKHITISAGNGLGSAGCISFFDKNYNFIGTRIQSDDNSTVSVIDIPENSAYFKTCFRQNNMNSYQIEYGENPTGYEPYHKPETTYIYLRKPLETGEILKFPENVILHSDGSTESITLPAIPTFEKTSVMTINTEIQPDNIEITYKSRKNDF